VDAGERLMGYWMLNAADKDGPRLSAHGADDLSVGGKAARRLFGISNTPINTNLEHTAARALQRHLRVWSLFADYARRLTGARFIASLTAVLDFDAHQSHSLFVVTP
jgi:hypothetical protein